MGGGVEVDEDGDSGEEKEEVKRGRGDGGGHKARYRSGVVGVQGIGGHRLCTQAGVEGRREEWEVVGEG